LRYTLDYELHYSGYLAVLEGLSDSNWISNTKDLKSTNGYIFTLGGADVLWKSFKQICITRSIMKLEFIALDKAEEKVKWI